MMTWAQAFEAFERGSKTQLLLPRDLVRSPATSGALPAASLAMVTAGPKPRRAWRWPPLASGGSYHVLEYDNFYAVHRDKADPRFDPVGHLIRDIAAPLLEQLPAPRLARVRLSKRKTTTT